MRAILFGGAWVAAAGMAWAASLNLGAGETRTVSVGETYANALVGNGGTLILDGGAFTTTPYSVTVEEGGRFIFNAGYVSDYVNYGLTELYGGTQSTVSSENRGQLTLAGGDPGIQIVHRGGMVDLYGYATNRTLSEIDVMGTGGSIRIWCLTSSLPPSVYSYATMPTQALFAGGKASRVTNRFWNAGVTWTGTLDIAMATNWQGTLKIVTYTPPTAFTSTVQPAVEIAWNAVSGRVYQVQSTTNLPGGVWRNVGLPVRADGSAGSFCDRGGGTSTSYRVLLRH